MASYVIVGAGPAGLYTAYRLLTGGTLQQGDTVQLYEWSERPGGRIYTYTFPDSIATDGLYVEVGGMRFAIDGTHFPGNMPGVTEGHVLLQNLIYNLGLANKVVPFIESPQRMYYLRGVSIYEDQITSLGLLPYNFSSQFASFIQSVPKPYTADSILGQIATEFAPGLGTTNADRTAWCEYFANGTVPQQYGTTSFPAGTNISTIGYWNLLYDQFGDEGFDYSADGTGYTSNVINWNSADAMQANNDYGSGVTYVRMDGGYGIIFEELAAQVAVLMRGYPGSGISYGMQLTTLAESATDDTTLCYFNGNTANPVVADQLFLAMPRRSLELVAGGCAANYPLNLDQVRYYLESSIDQPAIKAVMVFDRAWWTSPACKYPPQLTPSGAQGVGGPTITDLPLRQIYYFANNIPGGPGTTGGPYVL
ncbi:MAG TPA: FAD-dependent oxidoreductase, partial [Longimicrobiaceae bacterium]|nr:FAD-dependent oxidoreductase [Longimicrobiaceae bacterium]